MSGYQAIKGPALGSPPGGSGSAPDAHPDDAAIDAFAAAMKEKMATSRAKGRSGWGDRETCLTTTLAAMLIGHIPKGNHGNYEDIANLAMMLHQRGDHPSCLADALRAVIDDEWNKALAKCGSIARRNGAIATSLAIRKLTRAE